MKKIALPNFVLLMIISFILFACSFGSSQENTFHPFSTLTVLPTLTNTLISTPVSTVTPTRLETEPASTMTLEEQKNFVKKFLSDSGNCRLPCWWNVTPGQGWEDAEKTIQVFGGVLVPGIPGYDPETTSYGTSIFLKDIIPDGTISIEEKQGLVNAWHVSSTGGVRNPEEFRGVWNNYSAQKIVTAYGIPERILLSGNPASNSLQFGLYSLWLFYDELGFSIFYEARIPKYFFGTPFFRICSETDPLLSIEINTQSPDNLLLLDRFDRTLEEVRLGTEIGNVTVIHSLQEATGLSDEEIYEAFMQEKDPCLAIPSDIWRVK